LTGMIDGGMIEDLTRKKKKRQGMYV
jgi:hypothetical protein